MKAKDNPFSTEQISKIKYYLSETELENLIKRLKELNFYAALVGDHGSGKTTLLESIVIKLIELNYKPKLLRLNTEKPSFPKSFLREFSKSLKKTDIVILDGAEQLNFLSWQYFKYKVKNADGLIITTHKEGRLPTLYRCQTSYKILDKILLELLGIQAKDLEKNSQKLFDKHQGNIRNVLREYYDIYAQLP
jgi:DNA replication protein DnaC